MSGTGDGSDARALLLLCCPHSPAIKEGPAPLSVAEWHRIASLLRQAGLTRPGELLDVGEPFFSSAGLADEEIARLRSLLDRGDGLDAELSRLADQGIRSVTSRDPGYPMRLRERLRGLAPPILFGAGEWSLLERPGLAIAGSRDVDAEGAAFTRAIARRCVQDGLVVVTGGAKGVDQIALRVAMEAGGAVISVPAGDLERGLHRPEVRRQMEEGTLLLLSPFHPRLGFTIGNAMARNKVIYALAECGLVVSSSFGQGGTWAGAREVLRHRWVPLFVRADASVPDGNRELLRPAAHPFPPLAELGDEPLPMWLARQAGAVSDWVAGTGRLPNPQSAIQNPQSEDLFLLVWPRLAGFLQRPRRMEEIAAAFHLTTDQTQAWLHRGMAEGKVAQDGGSPARYRAITRLADDSS
jgi:DNA processing protein